MLCYAMLYYMVLYYIILYYTITGRATYFRKRAPPAPDAGPPRFMACGSKLHPVSR